jgi:hypothetical protein
MAAEVSDTAIIRSTAEVTTNKLAATKSSLAVTAAALPKGSLGLDLSGLPRRVSDNGDGKDSPGSTTGEKDPEDDDEDTSNATDSDDADEDSGSHADDRISSDDGMVSDAGPEQPASYFDFFGLPLEIRDMVYDQPQLLVYERIIDNRGLQHMGPYYMEATKADPSLLLVNHQFGSEYKKRCEERSGLSMSDAVNGVFTLDNRHDEVRLPSMAAGKASFLHLHVGDSIRSWFPTHEGPVSLEPLQKWLSHWVSRMPKLQIITMNLYLHHRSCQMSQERAKLIAELCDLISLGQLTEIKVIVMKNAEAWFSVLEADTKKLLVDWKRDDGLPPQLIEPMAGYEETCCSHLFLDNYKVYCPDAWSNTDESDHSDEAEYGE